MMGKSFLLIAVLIHCFIGVSISAAETPNELAGIVLGERIEKFDNQLKMDTALPTRYFESLKEVEIKKTAGFKAGLVYYGTCLSQKPVIRIKLKYRNASMDFFTGLLERFKDRFGEPDKWKGDPFHIVNAWKWTFSEKDGSKTSMILQHNTQNPNQKMGNSIKITRYDLMEKEYDCFEKIEKQKTGSGIESVDETPSEDSHEKYWERFIPKN